jgi:ADP-ribose pyrophosphatase YjhB (NUDIX family)
MIRQLFPLVSADVALFSVGDGCLRVLLAQRGRVPQQGLWALPGSVLNPDVDDSLEATARRALREKLGLEVPHLEQVKTFDGAMRDPRGWSLSVLYCALLPRDQIHAMAVSRVEKVRWADADDFGELAFDHAQLLQAARCALRERVKRHALPMHLLPQKFTLTQLQRVCEMILRTGRQDNVQLDKGAFRRRFAHAPDVVAIEGEFETGAQRPAQLYRMAMGFRF